jgi:hypothetical protein
MSAVTTLTPAGALNKVIEARQGIARLKGFPLLATLAAKGRVSVRNAGECNWNVDRGGGSAAYEATTSNSANTNTDIVDPASLTWGNFRLKHQFSINKVAVAKAQVLGPGELAALFAEFTDRGLENLFRELNNAIYLGDGSATYGGIQGLATINNPTATYAGIAPATSALWVPHIKANGGTLRALTADILRDTRRTMALNQTGYDTVVCHPNMGHEYQKLWEAIASGNAAYSGQTNQPLIRDVDMGLGMRYYEGRPIIEDMQAPTRRLFMLDSSEIDLFTLALPNSPNQGVGAHVVNMSYGIPVHITELSTQNSSVRTFELSVYPQLRMRTRKASTLISDLTDPFTP